MFEGLRVKDLIGEREAVYSVEANDPADVAARKLQDYKVRTIGVVNEGKLVGVVGQSDFANKVVAQGRKPKDVKVRDVMSTPLTNVGLDTTFLECLQLMDARKISHLIVLDEQGEYYGMLSWRDLQQHLVKELNRELQEKKEQLNLLQEFAFGPNVDKAP